MKPFANPSSCLGAVMSAGPSALRVAIFIAALSASLGPLSRTADGSDGSTPANDPCALALTPHEGTEKADREIIRLQAKVQNAADPAAWLESLGWAFVTKARVSFDPGFYKLAEQCALCLDGKKPGCAEARLLRAHVLHSLHRFKEAEAVARELVAQRGLHFDYGVLGDALMEQGRLDEAVAAYQAMMDQKPGPQAYSRAAHLRWLKGDLPGATELMSWAAESSSPADPEAAAWTRVRLARYQWQAAETKKALDLVDEALALQPDYPPALLERGRILLGLGDTPKAIDAVKRAADLNPLPEPQWTLIEALRSADRTEAARAVETQLLSRGAANDPRTLALYLATHGESVPVALSLAKAELETRADVFTYDALAWAWMASGDARQAWVFAQRAVREGTQDARLFLHAGVIARAAGEPEQAAACLAKATALKRMLLPSEQKFLEVPPAAAPAQPDFHSTQPSTLEKKP